MSTRGGVLVAGACFRTLARIRANASRFWGCAFWLLRPVNLFEVIACSRKTGLGLISRMRPSGDLEPGDQSPLPRPQASRSALARPFSRRDRSAARYRADNGRNCACPSPAISKCSPAIRGARASRSRCSRRSRVPSGSGRSTIALIDDRYPSRKGTEERMAPDAALRRNEKAERRKPILIDEMLERHRRRMDGVIDVVDALGVRRIDAERMQSGPVLRRRDDLALRERGRQASLIGDDRQIVSPRRGRLELPRWTQAARRAAGAGNSAMACERRLARPHAAID